jgi:hypothetical protein
MIADDTDAIRKAMEKLDWNKRVGEAEVKLKAQQGDKSTTPAPTPKPLFDEPGPPHFRGFFVEGLQPPVRGPGGIQFTDGTRSHVTRSDSNFDFDEYEQAWDQWDDATLDSGVTVETASLFMWGKLD